MLKKDDILYDISALATDGRKQWIIETALMFTNKVHKYALCVRCIDLFDGTS